MSADRDRRLLGRVLGLAIVLVALVALAAVAWLTGRHPRTDDATVQANVIGIAPHVSGPIVELPLTDNQPVKAGDLLFVVDPRPYEVALARARADRAVVESDLRAQQHAVTAADAQIAQRETEADYAADLKHRLLELAPRHWVTADRIEEARSRQRAADAALVQARSEAARARALLAQEGELNARRAAAEAAEHQAELDLGYCRVTAPFDGYVTNLNIAVGQYARQGEAVFALVDGRAWYVVANFRETYLDAIRPGAETDVYLVTYPGRRFRGVVEGIGWALHDPDAGQGILPLVRPSLDWVRLARRFPVRIRLDPPDPEHPYRMGATAVVTIRGDGIR